MGVGEELVGEVELKGIFCRIMVDCVVMSKNDIIFL